MTFAEVLTAANESKAKTGRGPGQWTPAAVETWRAADPEMSQPLEAAIAWELRSRRWAQPADEAEVREVRRQIDAATAAARAAKI